MKSTGHGVLDPRLRGDDDGDLELRSARRAIPLAGHDAFLLIPARLIVIRSALNLV